MNLSPNLTLNLSYAISSALCLVVMLRIWQQGRWRFRGIGFWLANYSLQLGMIVLAIGRGHLPDYLTVVAGETLVIAGTLLLYIGLERFVAQPGPQVHNYLLLTVFVGVHAYFTLGAPNEAVRNLNLSLGLLVLFAQCAWLLLRRAAPAMRPHTRNTGLVFVAYVLVNLSQVVAELAALAGKALFEVDVLGTVSLLVYQTLLVAITFSLLLLVNARAEHEWQQAETAQREVEARFRLLIENQGEGIGLVDVAEHFVFANPAAESIFGVPPGGLLGRGLQDFTTPEQFERLQQQSAARVTGAPGVYELEIARPTGEVRRLLVTATPRFEAGQYTGAFGIFRDITERQQAEAALRESERRLRQAQAIAGVGNWELDLAEQRLWASEEAFRIYGRERGVPFLPLGEAQRQVHPGDRAAVDEALRGLVEAGRPYSVEYRLIRGNDGAQRVVQARAELIYDSSGRRVKVAGVIQDITERKAMEAALREERALLAQRVEERTAELQQANAELIRAGRLKDEFLANMSHELRTPLTAILGLAESLQMGSYGPLPEQPVQMLQIIRRSGQHLLALINDILDLSKIEAGKLELQPAPTAVADICQMSLQFITQAAHKKNIRLTYIHDPLVRLMEADPRRLKQMLVNLLSNAVKFTPEGGAVGLEVTGDAAGREVRFTIWDTGIGIPSEKRDLLFQPFVQVDGSLTRKYEGAGLGLALTRRLAEMHGGGVSVESGGVGQGSRFRITLPWRPVGTPPRLSAELAPASKTLTVALGRIPYILLVDDNETVLMTVSDFLRSLSARVVTARTGQEALNLAQAERPDLILMDVQMPEMNGLEAIRRLRARPEMAHIPIVAITALVMAGDEARCLAAGATAYLGKPLRLADLQRLVAKLLKKAERSEGA